MATFVWMKKLLERKGVAFEEVHQPQGFTARETLRCETTRGHRLARAMVALIKGRPVVLILPASRRVVLSRLEKLLAADSVHLVSEAEIERLFAESATDAIPAERDCKDLEVLMDASLLTAQTLTLGAHTHEDAIRLKVHSWFPMMNSRVEFFTEPDQGPHGEAGGR
jgi:prolyl-tRNA editing enzyme YbaK/EbsC (Cys-tRNA(Pro) deacylase)